METGMLQVSAAEYHADPCAVPSLSASLAHTLIAGCPKHAWAAHPKLGAVGRDEPTKEMDRGTLLHKLVLGEGAELHIVDAADWRTKAAKEEREMARKAGRIPVLADQLAQAQLQSAQIRQELRAKGINLAGASEVAFAWEEESSDGAKVQCRGMADHYVGGTIYDLKIWDSAAPSILPRKITNMGSHIQSAAYVRGVSQVEPALAGRIKFVWLIVELEPVVQVVLASPSGTMRELGERQWRRAVDTWARCLASNDWPGHAPGPGVIEVEAPEWALAQDYRDAMEEAEAA